MSSTDTSENNGQHAAGDCTGGCEDVKQIELGLEQGATRMTSIEDSLSDLATKLDNHIKLSNETNGLVAEVLDILHAGKGFFRIVGYIATGIKWTAAVIAPVIALIYTLKNGGKV